MCQSWCQHSTIHTAWGTSTSLGCQPHFRGSNHSRPQLYAAEQAMGILSMLVTSLKYGLVGQITVGRGIYHIET